MLSVNLVDQLPAHITPRNVLFNDGEYAPAIAGTFPFQSDSALFICIVNAAARKRLALVLNYEKSSIF